MPRFIRFYYGMSGTLKMTTLNRELLNHDINSIPVYSDIKVWKHYSSEILNQIEPENFNYAILHLCKLKDYIKNSNRDLFIERGISDMAFFEKLQNGISDSKIKSLIDLETEVVNLGQFTNIERTLLIMNDYDFIRDSVLSESTRSTWFKTPEEYLKAQSDYVKFSKEWNSNIQEVVIDSAKDYLENKLKIKYYNHGR
jgi:hypothetical protein